MSLGAPIQSPSGVEAEGETSKSPVPPVYNSLMGGGGHRGTTADLMADNYNGYMAPKGKERATGACRSGFQSCLAV